MEEELKLLRQILERLEKIAPTLSEVKCEGGATCPNCGGSICTKHKLK